MSRDPRYDEKFLLSWGKTREKGRLAFAIKHGLLFGPAIYLGFRVFRYFTEDEIPELVSSDTLIGLVIFIIINALLGGTLLWNLNNIKYRRMQQMKG